jgi:hypothetical protein
MTPLPRPCRALSCRTSARLALAALVLVPACGDASLEVAPASIELRAGIAAAATPPPAPQPETAQAVRVEATAAIPEDVVVPASIEAVVDEAPAEVADVVDEEPGPWRGREPAQLRVRLYARSAGEANAGAQSLALRLESLGFTAEVLAPRSWRPERETTWLGDRTLDEVLSDGEAGLVLLPPASTSAGDLLREELGEELYRFVGRGTETRQHAAEGDEVDLVIDVLPRPGALQ